MRFQFSLRKLLMAVALIGAITAVITFVAQRVNPRISIHNKSAATLTNVVVSGNGFSKAIGTLAVGAEANVSLTPSNDSWITVTFDANGQHYDSGAQEYIAGLYGERFTATVEGDFQVHILRDR